MSTAASKDLITHSPPLAGATPSVLPGAEEPAASAAAQSKSPRKAPPSPISISRQDPQRSAGFASRRNSSSYGGNNAIYTASPTSELRTGQSLPTESATRSTFDSPLPPIRVMLSPSSAMSAHPVMTESPATSLAPTSLPVSAEGPGGGQAASSEQQDRPKGRGTLELERVLDMWAAKTPTNASFPNSVGLPPAASTSMATSQPFLTHSMVTAEPESLDFAAPGTRGTTVSTSSTGAPSSVFADFAQLASIQPQAATALGVRQGIPRRQRSRSEADLMRFDTMSLGGISLSDFLAGVSTANAPTSQVSLDMTQPLPVPASGGMNASAGERPNGLRLVTSSGPTSESIKPELSPMAPAVGKPFDFGRGFEFQLSQASPVDRNPVSGLRGRRARSQEPGHRYAKSDDLTHLLSTLSTVSVNPQETKPDRSLFQVSNGHLAAPTAARAPATTSSGPPGLSVSAPLPDYHVIAQHNAPVSGQPDLQANPGRPEFISLPNGMTLPIAYFAPLPPPPPPHSQAPVSLPPSTSSAMGQSSDPQLLSQFSPQGNALALAAAQAAQAHTASIAQAAAVATMQYSHGSPNSGIHAQAHSPFLPQPPAGPYHISTSIGGPYSYPSPTGQSLVLPTPPPVPGSGSSGRKTKRRTGARQGGDEFMDGQGEGSASSGGEDDDTDMYEDGPKPKKAKLAGKASGSKKPSQPRKKVIKKSPSSPTLDGTPTGDEDDEVSRESKTTRATLDAAKRRRNANAVAKFVCELCGETFTRRYNLRGHQRAHKGEKPYKCSYDGCDKSFARAHDCKRHELLHLGVRKYHCSPCARDFVRLDALHRHHRSEVGQACVKQLRAEGMPFDDQGAAIV